MNAAATSIRVSATPEFFRTPHGETVRAWTGVDGDGGEVVALVCGIRAVSEMADLVPVPPPVPEWSDAVRAAIARIWEIAGRLSDADARSLATTADMMVAGFQEIVVHANGVDGG